MISPSRLVGTGGATGSGAADFSGAAAPAGPRRRARTARTRHGPAAATMGGGGEGAGQFWAVLPRAGEEAGARWVGAKESHLPPPPMRPPIWVPGMRAANEAGGGGGAMPWQTSDSETCAGSVSHDPTSRSHVFESCSPNTRWMARRLGHALRQTGLTLPGQEKPWERARGWKGAGGQCRPGATRDGGADPRVKPLSTPPGKGRPATGLNLLKAP